jgi:hypothetical protein
MVTPRCNHLRTESAPQPPASTISENPVSCAPYVARIRSNPDTRSSKHWAVRLDRWWVGACLGKEHLRFILHFEGCRDSWKRCH